MKKTFAYILLRRILYLDENIILNLIKSSSKRILDIGCGYGYTSYLIAKKFPNSQVIGVDTDNFRINQAKEYFRLNNLSFFVNDAKRLNFKNKFDVILAIDLFHHIPSEFHVTILEKISNHLQKKGIFIMRDINKSSSFRFFNTVHDILINRSFCVNYKNFSEWVEILRKFDLKVEDNFHLPKFIYPYLYIISSKKRN